MFEKNSITIHRRCIRSIVSTKYIFQSDFQVLIELLHDDFLFLSPTEIHDVITHLIRSIAPARFNRFFRQNTCLNWFHFVLPFNLNKICKLTSPVQSVIMRFWHIAHKNWRQHCRYTYTNERRHYTSVYTWYQMKQRKQSSSIKKSHMKIVFVSSLSVVLKWIQILAIETFWHF